MSHKELLFAALYNHILEYAELAFDQRDYLIEEVIVVAPEEVDLRLLLLHNLHYCLEEIRMLECPERVAFLLELPPVNGVPVEDELFCVH